MKQYNLEHYVAAKLVATPGGFWIGRGELIRWIEKLVIEIKNTAGYDSVPWKMCTDLLAELED